MKFVRVEGKEDLESFVKNKWGIPEPPNPDEREDIYSSGGHLDLILCPGLGFDTQNQRLGRGKGYYDRYIQKAISSSHPPPKLIGIALKEQKVDSVPTDAHDIPMDEVLFPN
uniref:5-formyltetrahydrofolate cyclo-ligase n=2 Tax=Paramoeba aestuarina TaxID=180227 RepID=A0A7S4JL58_9EUKA|mmetsp:Transcript_11434/g.17291  ORF Transcript_11434/g.17291 Transcript_11434/m.17291 type:complete len:112 (+) Transcript_11434:106-441(+)